MFLLTLSMGACQLTAPLASEATQIKPEEVFTAAAQTAEARRLERAATTITPDAEEIIATSIAPTATTISEEPTDTPPQEISVTETTVIQTPGAPETSEDQAKFVADVSVPDGSVFSPGEEFTKTWKIENIGSTTWSTEYAIVYIDGALMSEATSIAIPVEVAPYEKVEISVKMMAPSNPGNYRSYWKFKNADGKLFGVGIDFNEAIWVDITVQSGTTSEEITPTKTAGLVSDVQLNVNNDTVISACPYTFIFTGYFQLKQPSSVTYHLELGDMQGSQLKAPPPMIKNLGAGTHPIVYEITFSNNLAGWARLSITNPENIISNQVQFELQCS